MNSLSLVKLINNEPVISHITISENTNNENTSIRKLIDNYKSDFEEFGQLSFQMTTVRNTVGAINEKKLTI